MNAPSLRRKFAFAFLAILAAEVPLPATVLTFNACGGGVGTAVEGNRCRYATINQNYGDRVTGPSMNGGRMQYGEEGEGWTPNILTSYGPDATAIHGWDNNYAGLWTVIWPEEKSGLLSIRFTADPGYRATFYGFRMAGYVFNGGPWPLTVGEVSVTNDKGTKLWSQTNISLDQVSPYILALQSPLVSSNGGWLELTIDVRNLPVGNFNRESVGLDLVRYGQTSDLGQGRPAGANPEGGSMSLILLGAQGMTSQFLRNRSRG